MARQIRCGDVLEVALTSGLGYLRYLGAHPVYGDAVSVVPAVFNRRPAVTQELFDDSYVTFYPARASARQGLVLAVGNVPAPPLPAVLRRPGVRSNSGVETWIIVDESGMTVKRTLSREECSIPIAAIWNHEYLIQRIAEGWRPESEG